MSCIRVTAFAVFVFVLATVPAHANSDFYKESPLLAAQVKADALRPVIERLPRNPMLIKPIDRIGQYGGIWRMGMRGNADRAFIFRTLAYEHMLRWDAAWKQVIPNVAQSVSVNKEATEYTFVLRQGMRWSDGHPFSADDVMFWYEDVLMNRELTPETPPWLAVGGKPVEVEKLGDFEVIFRFAAPNALFPQNLAIARDSGGPTNFPRHWLKNFHIRHNPDGLADEIKAAGAKDWVELFRLKSGDEHVPKSLAVVFREKTSGDKISKNFKPWPTLNAWMLTGYEKGAPGLITAERNPYYWKIDPYGQQLPYFDKVVFETHKTNGEIAQMAIAGRIGVQFRRISGIAGDSDILQTNREKGNFRFVTLTPGDSNSQVIVLNLTHRDPAKRKLFATRDFRVALSIAIDRSAILKKVFRDDYEFYQVAPRPESQFYNQRLATQHTEFDPQKANALLDALGLNKRNEAGLRLGEDGSPITINLLAREDTSSSMESFGMIAKNWRDIGIDAILKPTKRHILEKSVHANDFDAAHGHSDGGIESLITPSMYMPWSRDSIFGIGWINWFNNPQHPQAVEPPPSAKEQRRLYLQVQVTADPVEQKSLMKQILDIAADQFYAIGISLEPPQKGIVSNDVHNVPPVMIKSWHYPTPAPTNTSQYFYEKR